MMKKKKINGGKNKRTKEEKTRGEKQRRVHTKNEAEVKKWQRQFSKEAQKDNF